MSYSVRESVCIFSFVKFKKCQKNSENTKMDRFKQSHSFPPKSDFSQLFDFLSKNHVFI